MDSCSICLGDLEHELATVPNCFHTFHSHCLNQWSSRKTLCPNCNTPFTHWINQDDKSHVKATSASAKVDDYFDLGCLDHKFFREELATLMHIADQIYRDKIIGRGCNPSPYERRLYATTRDKIMGLSEANRNFLQFDEQFLMQEISFMHEELVSLRRGAYAEVELEVEDSLDSESSYDDYEDYYEY
mmetsp:Transcript_1878/g.4049  ORF Transcript_1878/g.4049 Transcript_1878/m.4049 type:complete len:187 (-) Transcript_1878:8685-9245(-)